MSIPAPRLALASTGFVLLAAVAAVALSFTMPARAADARGPSSAARDAVDALLHAPPGAALARIPDGFAADAGYTPRIADGMVVAPDGGCSSPVPLPASFTPACRAHDLGYDLLRYAAAEGRPLDAQARRGLDAQLAERLRGTCGAGDAGCAAAADAAAAAVAVNSWRQGYGVPVAESPGLYVLGGAGAAGAVFAAAAGVAGMRGRA